jgi:hypothetical protein
LAGARGWRLCDEVGRQALAIRVGGGQRGTSEAMIWNKRARQCPNEPDVLMLAAQEQIVEMGSITWGPDVVTGLEEVMEEHHARLDRARMWIDAALTESHRRGMEAPLEAYYLRAYAWFAGGRYAKARDDLRMAWAVHDVERWRLQRMRALVELFVGDLHRALELAHRGLVDAPPDDRLISRYIFALVLDRGGDPAAARRHLRLLRREPGHTGARRAFASLLPMHERIYLRALDHQANRERSNGVRLWEAYLSRPEPGEPDKELARRHLAESSSRPPLVEPAASERP